jgi:hypothetical protein
MKKANIEKVDAQRDKAEGKTSNLKNSELYNVSTAKTEHADLLGFQGGEEYYYEERRGRGGRGRGGRGGRGRGGENTGYRGGR